MHHSRLAGFIIDCKTDKLDDAARFWSAALGYPLKPEQSESDYRVFDAGRDSLHIEVQAVQHESRVHLDIETDDIEAEVSRLEKLGARRIKFFKRWWVMEAPTGQRFCVVRPQHENFTKLAKAWPE